jgi:hypothetical protein
MKKLLLVYGKYPDTDVDNLRKTMEECIRESDESGLANCIEAMIATVPYQLQSGHNPDTQPPLLQPVSRQSAALGHSLFGKRRRLPNGKIGQIEYCISLLANSNNIYTFATF